MILSLIYVWVRIRSRDQSISSSLSRLHRSEIKVQTLGHSIRRTGPRGSVAFYRLNPYVASRSPAISGH